MGEVVGIGISHYPPLSGRDFDMANILRDRLKDPDIPESAKDLAGWPLLMQQEWGEDEGAAAGERHREAMLGGLRRAREFIDEFKPDFVLIWGDDQYENFKEDIIPAFCVQAYEDMKVFPWRHATASAMFDEGIKNECAGKPNAWRETGQAEFLVRGHPEGAKHIASQLLAREFDIAYAYKPLHHPGLAHAFLNTVLYLDYDRKGFDYPVVPLAINCFGKQVVSRRGFISKWADRHQPLDPPSPSPRRCFDLGAAIGGICRSSPWRVALIASSSWSHAFLVDKTWRTQPDVAADRALHRAMVEGDYAYWRSYTLDRIEESGQQEVLNWFALMGAMNELGIRCTWSDFVETYVFNSSKVAAIFGPK